jgi:copper transport protein
MHWSLVEMRRVMRMAAWWGVAVWMLGALPLFAHTVMLVRSEPASGARLSIAPAQIKLWFSEELASPQSTLHLYDMQGQRVDYGAGGVDLTDLDHASLVLDAPALAAGGYTVCWQAVLIDGDVTTGAVVFVVGELAVQQFFDCPAWPAGPRRWQPTLWLAAATLGVVTVFALYWGRRTARIGLRLLIFGLVAYFALGTTRPAQAHATLISSEPADSAALETAPPTVRLWFSEAVSLRFSTVRLFDADGQAITLHLLWSASEAPNALTAALPSLAPGTYSLFWRVLSEADGHFSQGLLVFAIGGPVQAGEVRTVAPSGPPLPAEVLLRWLNYLGLITAAGAIAVLGLILNPNHRQVVDQIDALAWPLLWQRILVLAGWSLGSVLLVGLGLLTWQMGGFLEGTDIERFSPGDIWLVITQTRWGKLWLLRQCLLAILLGVVWWHSRLATGGRPRAAPPWFWGLVALLSAGLLLAQAAAGHAAGGPAVPVLTVTMTALHLLAASVWIGGLLALTVGLAALAHRDQTEMVTLAKVCLRAFSPWATVSVALLVASGLYQMGQQVASPDALLTTTYGHWLLGKIGLALLATLCGLVNTVILHPEWRISLLRLLPRPSALLLVVVGAEGTLGVLILLATGWIAATLPPRGIEFTMTADDAPNALSQTVDDLVVTLAVKPNRPGQNVFLIHSASSRRPPAAEITRVLLRFTYLEQEWEQVTVVAQAVEPGRYLLTASELRMAGRWRIDVVTRRHGVEDSVARFDWVMPPLGEVQPVVLSKAAWGRPLNLLAAGVLLFCVGGVIGWWRRCHLSFQNQCVYAQEIQIGSTHAKRNHFHHSAFDGHR